MKNRLSQAPFDEGDKKRKVMVKYFSGTTSEKTG
jgi:hypothetical protein